MVPIDTGLQVQTLRLLVGRAEEVKARTVGEISRTEILITELQGRLIELRDETEKSDAGIRDARAPLDRLLADWPTEKQRAAITLSDALNYEDAVRRAAGSGDIRPQFLGSHELAGDFRPEAEAIAPDDQVRAIGPPGTNFVRSVNTR